MSSITDTAANEDKTGSSTIYDYIVVEFGAPGGSNKPSGSVEAQVLSSRWLQGNKVFWPKCSSSKKLYKLIKCHQEPHTDVKIWDKYEISRIVGRSNDYQKAQKILEESDFTENEDQVISQRSSRKTRGKAPARYLQDSGDEEDDVNDLQESNREIPHNDSVDNDHDSVNGGDEGDGSSINEPIIPPQIEIDISNLGTSEVMRAISNSVAEGNEESVKNSSESALVEAQEEEDVGLLDNANKSDEQVSFHIADMSESDTQETDNIGQKFCRGDDNNHSQTCMLCNKCALFLERIANVLESRKCQCERKAGTDLVTEGQIFATLPCTTPSAVIRFEEYLEKEENMNIMVSKFRSFASPNLTTFVNSCLRKILTDDLATRYNAKGSISEDGTRVKEEYLSKNFISLLMNTVVHSLPIIHTAPTASVANVKNVIAGWFRNAKKRCDARSKTSRSTPRPESAASSISHHSTVKSGSSRGIVRPDSAPFRPESRHMVRFPPADSQRFDPQGGNFTSSPNRGFNNRSRYHGPYSYEESQNFTQSPTHLRYSNERTPDRSAWKGGPAPNFRYSPYRSPQIYEKNYASGDSFTSWDDRYSSAGPSHFQTPQKRNRGRAPPRRPHF
ncbi:uncharacterized protein LOC135944193 [Cloeon dipterum]|uniref:uncharacterized protein LOC135944193 n=1 Tax=Cloeon dipterum TaxID=197152 RepID=UPI00322067D3